MYKTYKVVIIILKVDELQNIIFGYFVKTKQALSS